MIFRDYRGSHCYRVALDSLFIIFLITKAIHFLYRTFESINIHDIKIISNFPLIILAFEIGNLVLN